MVCMYCGSKTQVINSRHQKASGRTWRRRSCKGCRAVFTTFEVPDWSSALLVQKATTVTPFSAQKHIISLADALNGSQKREDAAYYLHTAIMPQLLKLQQNASIGSFQITRLTAEALRRYDYRAYLRYIANHDGIEHRPISTKPS